MGDQCGRTAPYTKARRGVHACTQECPPMEGEPLMLYWLWVVSGRHVAGRQQVIIMSSER